MWIFSRDWVFASVVSDSKAPGTLLVRFRRKSHAMRFLALYPLGALEATPKADYRYRVLVHEVDFVKVMADQVRRIHYGNFKNALHLAHDDPEVDLLAHRVWGLMAEFQESWTED